MAKKKRTRSANVARKREKRNRNKKSRQKRTAVEKQRRLPYEKSEEEHLHACISQSRELLLEPEFEGVLFDPEQMYTQVIELLGAQDIDGSDAPTDPSIDENLVPETKVLDEDSAIIGQFISKPEPEQTGESFQVKVLPHLVTPEFMRRLCQALTACETRLKLTGKRNLAEAAYVNRSLFEVAPPKILAFHPMIQAIGIETLRVLVEEQEIITDWRDGVKEVLSDVLENEDSEPDPSQQIPILSETSVNNKRERNEDTESATEISAQHALSPPGELSRKETTETIQNPETLTNSEESIPDTASQPVCLLPDKLPARALYKNFNGLAIKDCFEGPADEESSQNGLLSYALVNENKEQIEFVDIENERYVKITEERLQLHARSEAELSVAMAEVEARCTSELMYLAKTIEERR